MQKTKITIFLFGSCCLPHPHFEFPCSPLPPPSSFTSLSLSLYHPIKPKPTLPLFNAASFLFPVLSGWAYDFLWSFCLTFSVTEWILPSSYSDLTLFFLFLLFSACREKPWLSLPGQQERRRQHPHQSFRSPRDGRTEKPAPRGPRSGPSPPSLARPAPTEGSLLCTTSPGMASSSNPTSWRSLSLPRKDFFSLVFAWFLPCFLSLDLLVFALQRKCESIWWVWGSEQWWQLFALQFVCLHSLGNGKCFDPCLNFRRSRGKRTKRRRFLSVYLPWKF